jgi:hypothetical protein
MFETTDKCIAQDVRLPVAPHRPELAVEGLEPSTDNPELPTRSVMQSSRSHVR